MASEPLPKPPGGSAASITARASRRTRLPLGRSPRRLSYEHRLRLWLSGLATPALIVLAVLVHSQTGSWAFTLGACGAFAVCWSIAALYFFDQLIRPLQTLANVVAALREDDFSFRARGARRGDALGDLALEVNALAGMLQSQRSSARDALALLERVMGSMQSPVVAFDPEGRLRLFNQAGERNFALAPRAALGRSAADLGLATLLTTADKSVFGQDGSAPFSAAEATRWSVSRSTFRLNGVPHTLFVLSDVAAALREEERLAWQRLIRVLSHEINNSLTPIQSIAGSLRTRFALLEPPVIAPDITRDTLRGLSIIEERAASLNRFLQAYQQLTRLPSPRLRRISVRELLEGVVALETRLAVKLTPGPRVETFADPDQLQQLLINLIRNAADAALTSGPASDEAPQVSVTWTVLGTQLLVAVLDNGSGLTNPANAFVPFYTTKPGGSGIGLVLARQIAAAHRGSVTLVNRDDAPGCIAELHLSITTV